MPIIHKISLSKIKPDPEQPRKFFDKVELEQLAKNIKEVGVINPIEVDTDYKIITGERRYRASKLAGLKEIPIVVRMPKDNHERFFRQVSENVHHNTMNPWETAKALDKLLTEDFIGKKKLHATKKDKGVARLSEKLGLNPVNTRRMLKLLEERDDVQEALKENKVSHTLVFEIRSAPPQYQNELRDRMLKGEFDKSSKAGVRMLTRALRTQPKQAKKLLAGNYTGMNGDEIKSEILRRAPEYTDTPISQQLRENLKGFQQIVHGCSHLKKVLDANPPATIPEVKSKQAVMEVIGMMTNMRKWFRLLPKTMQDKIKDL